MEVNRIHIIEFLERGYLQEVNRQFFHPLGLALEVDTDDMGKPISLGGVWDYRDDPEGINFLPGGFDKETTMTKYQNVQEEFLNKSDTRKESLGYVVQPIEDMCKD